MLAVMIDTQQADLADFGMPKMEDIVFSLTKGERFEIGFKESTASITINQGKDVFEWKEISCFESGSE